MDLTATSRITHPESHHVGMVTTTNSQDWISLSHRISKGSDANLIERARQELESMLPMPMYETAEERNRFIFEGFETRPVTKEIAYTWIQASLMHDDEAN